MKKYEIREIDPKEMKRVSVYFADEIEIKKDDYGTFVGDKQIGKKVGFKIEGKNRKTWIHTVRAMVQIVNTETGDVTVLKSNEQELRELGMNEMADKYFG